MATQQAGAVALVGSGEYLDVMNETDRYLMETLGGVEATRVVLLPLASGLEQGSPKRWNEMGQRHFAALGVQDVRSSWIINRDSATDPEQVDLLRGANFYYFSGGNPTYVIESLRGTPAWEVIAAAHANGAVLAGCSAGAMALSSRSVSPRVMLSGGRAEWTEALGIVPNVIVFPHFDRMMGMIGRAALQTHVLALPKGYIALGIDEDTALVSVDASKSRWRVMGKQTVTIFREGQKPQVQQVGDEIVLS